jgi:hypothetical protein
VCGSEPRRICSWRKIWRDSENCNVVPEIQARFGKREYPEPGDSDPDHPGETKAWKKNSK